VRISMVLSNSNSSGQVVVATKMLKATVGKVCLGVEPSYESISQVDLGTPPCNVCCSEALVQEV